MGSAAEWLAAARSAVFLHTMVQRARAVRAICVRLSDVRLWLTLVTPHTPVAAAMCTTCGASHVSVGRRTCHQRGLAQGAVTLVPVFRPSQQSGSSEARSAERPTGETSSSTRTGGGVATVGAVVRTGGAPIAEAAVHAAALALAADAVPDVRFLTARRPAAPDLARALVHYVHVLAGGHRCSQMRAPPQPQARLVVRFAAWSDAAGSDKALFAAPGDRAARAAPNTLACEVPPGFRRQG